MPNWNDDSWILAIVEQVTGIPVQYLSNRPECSGPGNPTPYLMVDGRPCQIPIDQFRCSKPDRAVKRWLKRLGVM